MYTGEWRLVMEPSEKKISQQYLGYFNRISLQQCDALFFVFSEVGKTLNEWIRVYYRYLLKILLCYYYWP